MLPPHPDVPFGREEEFQRLRDWFGKSSTFLFFGAPGTGKTMLLNAVLRSLSGALDYVYCKEIRSRDATMRLLGEAFVDRGDAYVLDRLSLGPGRKAEQVRRAVAAKSSLALRGILREALRRRPRILILDHVEFVSQPFFNYWRDLHLLARIPIVAVARTWHMEEIGYLESLYLDRRMRLELENFDPTLAAEFAHLAAGTQGLEADNREEFLDKVVKVSQGNPAAILKMLEMARLPRYRAGRQVRLNILAVDYCIEHRGVRK